MKILLDENFPLALLRKLREEGREAEHIILLGLRGTPDSFILARLNSEELLFLTSDQEFLRLPLTRSAVIISRVTQSLPIAVRLPVWLKAIREYFSRDWGEKLFEVFDDEAYVRGRHNFQQLSARSKPTAVSALTDLCFERLAQRNPVP